AGTTQDATTPTHQRPIARRPTNRKRSIGFPPFSGFLGSTKRHLPAPKRDTPAEPDRDLSPGVGDGTKRRRAPTAGRLTMVKNCSLASFWWCCSGECVSLTA